MTQEDGGAIERNAEQVPVMDYAPRQALSLGKLAIGMLAVEVFAVIAFGWSDWRSRRWPIGTPPEMESSFFAACSFVVGMAAAVATIVPLVVRIVRARGTASTWLLWIVFLLSLAMLVGAVFFSLNVCPANPA